MVTPAPGVSAPNASKRCRWLKSARAYSPDRSYEFGGIQPTPLVSLYARPKLYSADPLKKRVTCRAA